MLFDTKSQPKGGGEGILIAYFSHSGNTRRLAEEIRRRAGGALLQIKPDAPYPARYEMLVAQAKEEIENGHFPSITAVSAELEPCYTVFVGSPNWWGTIAPPVASFLAANDFTGKIIVPFCTHGGGGAEMTAADVARLCPEATVLGGFAADETEIGKRDMEKRLRTWLHDVGAVR